MEALKRLLKSEISPSSLKVNVLSSRSSWVFKSFGYLVVISADGSEKTVGTDFIFCKPCLALAVQKAEEDPKLKNILRYEIMLY